MSKGMMIVVVAALVGLLFFFLPWFGAGGMSVSGWQLAKTSGGYPILFLMLLAMIACLVLVFLVFQSRIKIRMAAIAAIALGVISLVALVIFIIQAPGGLPTMFGFWITILANLGIIAGGVLDYLKP